MTQFLNKYLACQWGLYYLQHQQTWYYAIWKAIFSQSSPRHTFLLSLCRYRYKIDIILAVSKEQIKEILHKFNNYHNRIKFIVDHGDGDSINFLDVKLLIEHGRIIFDSYKKPTNSGRYLNLSNHLIEDKRAVIIGQFDRIIYLSHPKFQENNISKMIKTLMDNDYPLDFIFITINNRIKSLSHKYNLEENTQENSNNNFNNNRTKRFFAVPYLNKISKKFKRTADKFGFRIAYKLMNKLDKFIKTRKDVFKKEENCNVVHKINYQDCKSSYVGQTKRKLKTRNNQRTQSRHKKNQLIRYQLFLVIN